MRIGRSIRSQLVILALIVGIPLFLLVLYATYRNVQAEIDRAHATALVLAQITATHVEQRLSDAEALLVTLAQRPQIRAMDPAQCDPILSEFPTLFPHYVGPGVVDLSGQTVSSATTVPATEAVSPPSVRDRAWFQRVIRTQAFTVGEVQVGRLVGRWVSVLAYPVLADDGGVAGAILIPIDKVERPLCLHV